MTNIQIPEIPASVSELVRQAESDCEKAFARVEDIERVNTRRVIRAFQEYRVAGRHFAPTTGYGLSLIHISSEEALPTLV